MRDRRRDAAPEGFEHAPPEPAPPEPDVLTLQRSAGNAAVARLLQRQPAFSPIRPDAPVKNPLDPSAVAGTILADNEAAGEAVHAYFDQAAAPFRESGRVMLSIPELVYQACEQPFTRKDGSKAIVRDAMQPGEVETHIRVRARSQGMGLTEHRDASDMAGVQSEMSAVLANLGAIPTEIKLGDDDLKVVASISGKITAEGKIGKGKVEGELSSEGVEATATLPGGGKVTGKVGPEGGGGSVTVPGGPTVGVEATTKGVKAEIKAGDFITVKGSLVPEAGGVGWTAEISIGTIGKLIMPEDVAKVFKGAQDTFSKSAGELVRNRDDPAKVKEHGAALAGAISEAVEKAKKSASQKPGWRIGAELKGDATGGVSGSITFTWVF